MQRRDERCRKRKEEADILNLSECRRARDADHKYRTGEVATFFFFPLDPEEKGKDYGYVYWQVCKFGCG